MSCSVATRACGVPAAQGGRVPMARPVAALARPLAHNSGCSLRLVLAAPARARASRVTSTPKRHVTTGAVKKSFGSFAEMIAGEDTPVLVDFYATWCGPCQMLTPILEEVGASLRGKVKVVKINTETYPALASKYGINALPTVVLFKDGEPVDRIEGLMKAQQYVDRISQYLR